MVSAHRYSYKLHFGGIPKDLNVLHDCDNRACVNPEHLWLGTQQDNVLDAVKKGRWIQNRGESHPKSKLTVSQVRKIRDEYVFRKVTMLMLATKYGVSKSSIADILYGRHWQRF